MDIVQTISVSYRDTMPEIKGEVTRANMPAEWDAAERRRSLFQHWVEADYEIVDGVLSWVRDADEEGGGYLPMATPSIVGDFARLRVGDTAMLCAFARRWGSLGYEDVAHRDLSKVPEWTYGDPVAWVWAHVAGIQTALALWKFWRERDVDALAQFLNRRRMSRLRWHRLQKLDQLILDQRYVEAQRQLEAHVAKPGRNGEGDSLVIVWAEESRIVPKFYPRDHEGAEPWSFAWRIIREIINPNLRGVHAALSPYFPKDPNESIVAQGWDALISVIYRHIFEIISSGEVEECRECHTPFIRTDGRQRFCPPPPSRRESQCAMRFHKREQRRRARGDQHA